MFIRFDTMHERDRQTDRQTPHDAIGRAHASSGKNKVRFLTHSTEAEIANTIAVAAVR